MSHLPSSPYKGLSAFDDSDVDALLFFGREREREVIVANLIASRLTVLYGPSGVGKSSLLCAAVARSLRALPEEPLVVVFSRWAGDPARALAAAVGRESLPLVEALEEAQSERDVYLVLDQAEEYFLYHAEDAGPGSFAEALPVVLAAPLRVNVLVSLREDSLAKLDRFGGRISGLFANTLRLDRLDRVAAEAAIVRPVERFSEHAGEVITVDPVLVERVLDEVGTGRIGSGLGGLGGVDDERGSSRIEAPYLQLVMQRLWEEESAQGSSELRAETLVRLGGARQIVEEHLEGALDALSPAQKDIAARLFNHLVTPSGTKIAHEVSDLADFGDVSIADVEPVLRVLTEARILRSLEEGGTVHYEIFHDVLAHPVLGWRARHRTEREVERQRELSRRRQRWMLVIVAAAVLVAGAMAAVTAYAISQRNEAQSQAESAQMAEAEAEKQASIAEREQAEAEQQRAMAQEAQNEAQQQADAANQSQQQAEASQQDAEQSAAEANAASSRADESAAAATRAKRAALQQATRAKEQRNRARSAEAKAKLDARAAHARALAERSQALLSVAPLMSVRLALRATRLEPNGRTADTLRQALASSRVRAVLSGGGGPLSDAVFGPGGRYVLTVAREARIFDAHSGALVRTLGVANGVASRAASPPAPVLTIAVFGPDGSMVATGGSDGTVRLWPRSGGAPMVIRAHSTRVNDIAFSDNGHFLVTAGADRTALVWSVATGDRLATLQLDGPVLSAAFSPDGTRIVTVSRVVRSGLLHARLFVAATGKPLLVLDEPGVRTALFGPDGSFVVTTSNDGTTRIWSPTTGALEKTLRQPDGNVVSAAFSPDRSQLVTGSTGGSAYVWTVGSWEKSAVLSGPLNPVTDASFSPDGRFVVVSSLDRTARVYRSSDGLQVAVLSGHSDGVVHASFGPGGRTLVTASKDGTARVWDPGTADALQLVGKKSDAPIRRASFSPDGKLAVSAGADGTARVLLVSRRRQVEVLRHEAAVNDAEFSPGGKLIVTASADHTARIWRLDGTQVQMLSHPGQVLRAIFSPDGTLVATASDDHDARIWRVRDGRLLRTLHGHTAAVLDLAFSPDGRLLATAGDVGDNTARVWTTGGRELHVLRHRGPVVRVTFSHGGRLLATASGDELARLWRVRTGALSRVLGGHTAFVRDIEFSTDDRRVVTASDDGDARIWNVATGVSVETLRGHFNAVRAASFSPDGHWVVTAGPRTAGLWNTETGHFFAPTGLAADPFLRGHAGPGPLTSASFSPDGRRLLTASSDGTVRTFDCDVCGGIRELARLAQHRLETLDREIALAERRR